MQTSGMEARVIKALEENSLEVFTTRDIRLLAGLSQVQTYNIIKLLKKHGHIRLVKNGLYYRTGTDEMVVAARAVYPSYISFLSALNYYGYSDQTSGKLTIATTTKQSHKDYICVHISRSRFFGYTHINNIVIAEREKALIDSLYMPKYSGGIKEIIKCFRAAKIGKRKIYEYATKMQSRAVMRRLGFVMEHVGMPLGKKIVIGRGYELLEPSNEKKHNYNKKWLLDVNL
ncbi:MAG: hypothetical protein ABIF10_07765 [Candidatus Woesearchaeota archaeon]